MPPRLRQSVPDLPPEGPDYETVASDGAGPGTGKTAGKTAGRPFRRGADPRRGAGKKGRSGRRPDWLKALMAEGRGEAVECVVRDIRANKLDTDQLLKVIKEWAPSEGSQLGAWTVVMREGEVRLVRRVTDAEIEEDAEG